MIIAINAVSAKSGGNKTYLENLINSFRKHNEHTFHIWVPYDSNFKESDNIILHGTKAVDYNFILRFIYEQVFLKIQILRIKADVLYSSAQFGILSKKIPQVLLLRNSGGINKYFLSEMWPYYSIFKKIKILFRRILSRLTAHFSEVILFPSYAMKNDFLKYYSDYEHKFQINYYGIPNLKFESIHKSEQKNRKINLLYVSVYYTHKNPGVIADAVKIIKQKGLNIFARITMDMESNSAKSFYGWEKDYKKIMNPEIKDNIILGSVKYNKVRELYANADIFLFPSYLESFGFPMVEAMAAGLPIIAADTPINNEICGKAAIYFSPFDAKDLAKKIVFLLENSELRDKMILECKNRIELFKWEDHVSRLIKIFEELHG